MKLSIASSAIEIITGDIALQDTEAIVNAANDMLWMGSGVAGSIKRHGGESIEEEAVALGPIPLGEVAVTRAGSLKAKRVFHAAVIGQDFHAAAEVIARAARNCLTTAEASGVTSISIPALGTGVGRFSVHHCANIMLNEAINFLIGARTLKLVRFVLFDDETRKVFEDELHLQFSVKKHPPGRG